MTDREQFPHSVLWKVECPDYIRDSAARDPQLYAILLRLEGLPYRGMVIRPVQNVVTT